MRPAASGFARGSIRERPSQFSPLAALLAFSLVLLGLWAAASPAFQVTRAMLLLVALGRVGDRVGSCLARARDRVERAWIALLVASGAAVALATVLGASGLLSRSTYFLGVGVSWLLIETLLPSPRPTSPLRGRRGRLPAMVALAFAAAVLAQDLYAERYRPAGATAYDDVSYHLPAALLFDRYGDLRTWRFPFGDPSTSYYPLAGELASWVLFAPFAGSDLLARWSQLPAAVGLLLVAWRLAREAGSTVLASTLTVPLLLAARRLYPDLSLSAGNDLWAAFAALSLVLAAARWRRRPTIGEAALAGIALGLLVGTKYLALLALPGALAWMAVLRRAPGAAAARRSSRSLALVACAAPALLIGGFTYLRNTILLGNPVFPQPIRFLSWELLPGWQTTGLLARRALAGDSLGTVGDLLALGETLAVPWRWALLPSVLGLPLALFVARRRLAARRRFALALAVAVVYVVAIYLFLLYEHRDVRQLAALFPLLGAAAARALDLASGHLRTALLLSVGLGFALPPLVARSAIELGALLFGAAFAAAAVALRRWPKPVVLAGLLAGAALVVGTVPLLEVHAERRLRFEPLALELERLTAGASTVVAYVGGNRPYPYWGSRFQNRVEIVPADAPPDCAFHGGPSRGRCRGVRARSIQTWISNLSDLGIQWIVLDREGTLSPERRWMERRSKRFDRVSSAGWGEIWRFLP